MTFVFRPSEPDDAPAIAELCTRVLAVPEQSPVFALEHMHWKYWTPWPLWSGSRSFLLLRGEKLVAHAGVVPLRFARNGRTHSLVQLIDWAAERKQVGAGALLLQRIVALAAGAVSVRGSTLTQRMLTPLGFRSLGETVQFVAPVSSAPRPTSELARRATLRVHGHGRFEAREHPLSQAESSEERIVLQRTAAQFAAWTACPVAETHYGEVLLGERMVGSFVVCHAPGQARIGDVWADDQVPGAWEAVLELAYQHGAQQDDVSEVICQSNDPRQVRALRACGFVAAGSDPLAILCSPELVPDGALLQHHLLDSDLAYLHHGEPESWLRQIPSI